MTEITTGQMIQVLQPGERAYVVGGDPDDDFGYVHITERFHGVNYRSSENFTMQDVIVWNDGDPLILNYLTRKHRWIIK